MEAIVLILYSTGCDRCLVLEAKLDALGVDYEKVVDPVVIVSKGIMFVPALEVDGEILPFKAANDYINSLNT